MGRLELTTQSEVKVTLCHEELATGLAHAVTAAPWRAA
jgi:hypothetical protein